MIELIKPYDGNVSIHASREGRDAQGVIDRLSFHVFQSTRPVKDATRVDDATKAALQQFQSTRPVKDATVRPVRFGETANCFNPRVP